VEVIVELDGIKGREELWAGSEALKAVNDGLVVPGLVGDLAERVGVNTQEVEARGVDRTGVAVVRADGAGYGGGGVAAAVVVVGGRGLWISRRRDFQPEPRL
jgi:hypothetical protein